MSRAMLLEPFGRAITSVAKAPAAPEPVKIEPPEETALYRAGFDAGHEAGRAEGYAAGAAAAAADHKAVLAVAADAIARAAADRADIEARVSDEAALAIRAALQAVLPQLMANAFADEAVAELKRWIARAAHGQGVLVTAPETRSGLRDALSEDPALSELDVRIEDGMDQFAMRFEWRDGLVDFNVSSAAAAVLDVFTPQPASAPVVSETP